MAQQVSASQSKESFEYEVVSTPNQISPWIDPNVLKPTHRIGRGPFGDVWIATHHQSTEDYDEYHEVAVKMLYPIKDDQMQAFLSKFYDIFSKCQGLQGGCVLHGISNKNGNVCIAMKFYEGSVGDRMSRLKGGKLSLSDVLRYGIDLAQAILELHSRGMLILNLKPCNFLLDEHDQALLGDFGIPSLIHGFSLPSPDIVQRLGTPNYMAPEQWQPDVRGPLSFETDSWGYGCSIVEMLSGIQPWHGRPPDEIYHLVVTKQEKPNIPSDLPPAVENVLYGCFEYDLRNRPSIADILHAFKSCRNTLCDGSSWAGLESRKTEKPIHGSRYTDWSLLKDHLQVGDTVRSRKPKNFGKPENMDVPEGTVVGLDTNADREVFALVRVYGIHAPLRVHSSKLERVTFGFAVGDWVRIVETGPHSHQTNRLIQWRDSQGLEEDQLELHSRCGTTLPTWTSVEEEQQCPMGILHSIERDGRVTAGFIGMGKLWEGSCSELQMAESYRVGQFVRLKAIVSSPRFEWPCKRITGRIVQVLPNGCLVVSFPGKLVLGDVCNFLADPSQVELVSFTTCEGLVKKYQHLEDFHWAVRPLVIALGLFTALKLGLFVGKNSRKSKRKKKNAIVTVQVQ